MPIQDRWIEVDAVQLKGHAADAQARRADTHPGPGDQDEVEGASVVDAAALENQTTEITLGSHTEYGRQVSKVIALDRELAHEMERARAADGQAIGDPAWMTIPWPLIRGRLFSS